MPQNETPLLLPLQLPQHVLDVKKSLEQDSIRLSSTVKKLTETDDIHLAEELEKMWALLENAEMEQHGGERPTDDYWVRSFINHIASCTGLPDYCYQNQSQKNALIEDFELAKDRLARKLQAYDFDYRLSLSNEGKDIAFYERLSYRARQEIDGNGAEKPRISEMLDMLMKCIKSDVNSVKPCRDDPHKVARGFVCDVDEYLRNVYGDPVENKDLYPLKPVIGIVTMAILDVEYTESQINKILEREDKGKQLEDNWLFAREDSGDFAA